MNNNLKIMYTEWVGQAEQGEYAAISVAIPPVCVAIPPVCVAIISLGKGYCHRNSHIIYD